MTQRKQGNVGAPYFLRKGATALMGGLLLAAAGAMAQDDTGLASAPTTSSAASARTLYRVTNLGQGDIGVTMNAKGQVAFAYSDPFGQTPLQAWFYDGSNLHEIDGLGGGIVRPTGLNDGGQVTGIATTAAGLVHSFVWSRRHGATDVGTLPGMDTTWEPAINNRGEVTGYSTGDPSPPWPRAFRWSAQSGMQDLGVLLSGDDSTSYGRAINDAGLIAGDAWAGGHAYHAFVWTRANGMIDIDTLGNDYSTPVAVGARGQVAGNVLNPPNNYGSVFWWSRTTGMRDLGAGNGQGTWMTGMSPGGRIVGTITYPDFSQHAMTWTPAPGMLDLGTLGGRSSGSTAANDRDQVVGGAATAADSYHAFIWTPKEGMVDLNQRLYRAPAGLELFGALAISDNGSIVASSNAGLLLLRPVQACRCTHAAGPIVSNDLVELGAPVDTTIGFAADDTAANYEVAWSWGDGTVDRARRAGARNGSGSAQASHTYSAPGIYTVTADVTDQAGNRVKVARRIVVYAPAGGVLAGTGTVVLPAAASRRSPSSTGKAAFSFMAPTAAGAQLKAASAKGRFMFSLPGLSFASDDVQVAAAQGSRVRLAGTGTVNGARGYQFAATAGASGPGTAGQFGVTIWHTDPKTRARVIDYDSLAGTNGSAGSPIVEGKIVAR
ncbi:PKD domain-containing protein [Massilia cellulosiltytica]|uniref:PKD domain-containing protein n=1 Tax=Massilia cellulosiltytica TaxID=2683234 RepID=UPI0039B5F591